MANTSIQITLPEPAMAHLNAAVANGEFSSAEEYVAFLVESEVSAQAELEARLLDSLDHLEGSVTFTSEELTQGDLLAMLKKDASTGP